MSFFKTVFLLCLTSFCANVRYCISEELILSDSVSVELFVCEDKFIFTDNDYSDYINREDVIVIASPGRSGSTYLTDIVKRQAIGYTILKTHQHVPKHFKGKILFIFSNPDLAAESALHCTLDNAAWGVAHFMNVFSSDKKWLEHIHMDSSQQTLEHNLLSYDALGCEDHIREWLFSAVEHSLSCEAEILAIKYENLWDDETQSAIKEFCSIPKLTMSEKKQRGYCNEQLSELELSFRNAYNEGTSQDPRYRAYNAAREIWREAPPFQFLKIKQN